MLRGAKVGGDNETMVLANCIKRNRSKNTEHHREYKKNHAKIPV